MGDKEIHFYTYKDVKYNNYYDTLDAIEREEPFIETSQMGILSFDLETVFGYNIYIHEGEEDFYLISCDEDRQCERTYRNLKHAHNLFKMWMANEFTGCVEEGKCF